ncbi:MAG TPA: NfeD family protein [Candidatus Cloacimonadota bacterium]|nr:NfeD family protein [Candidatus Cloacimonadota bacterium]HPS38038.1 NfeD family protein [Candidatus Cloacimonadota bacterium]
MPEIALQAWHWWMIIGIGFVIIEIFDPAFFFISLGIGAILTGLLALIPFVNDNIALQILIFAIISFIAFLFMRRLGKKVLANPGGETNVNALIGKTGFVVKEIQQDGKGYVKIGGEEWSATAEDGSLIAKDSKVTIIGIDGNKVIVRAIQS